MSQPIFNPSAMLPGDIICRDTPGWFSTAIKRVCKSPWSHDALIVSAPSRFMFIGDALWGKKAALNPLCEWEQLCETGGARVIVLRPTDATEEQGYQASRWWCANVKGHKYDWRAIFHLLLKWIAGEHFAAAVGDRVKFFCTEGCRDAWMLGASLDPWAPKVNVTPGTTAKRLREGRFYEVANALTEYGWQFRVKL